MYSGIVDGGLLEATEIFSTIQNANFLGIDELLGKAAESFASRWKILAFSSLFRRSIVDSEFVGAILELGTKNIHLVTTGAHNPERANSVRSCHGVFTDQFISRTVLARILNIFSIPQTSQQKPTHLI